MYFSNWLRNPITLALIFFFSFAGSSATQAQDTYQSSLIQTIDTSGWSRPSPDPAGIVYLPGSDTLLVCDSEVNEMPIFTDDNLFEATLTGDLIGTLTTISFSDEPSGVTLNPYNRHLFFSDDTGTRSIYELDPGPDGLYDTGDDSITSFATGSFGSYDPEGVTFAHVQCADVLFIADGVNREVYRVDPGANGIFDGVDDQVTSFDTTSLGLEDPEGIAFNPDNGNLYVVGKPSNTLFEITTDGALVRTIDISAANARKPAGLAYAPSSQSPGEMSIYIAARGVDNNTNPNENDGKVYEMTLPKASIDIEKEVSVDGGYTFHDADTVKDAPVVEGEGAIYRLIVSNNGDFDLKWIFLRDRKLRIWKFIRSLKVGHSIIFTKDDRGFRNLSQPGQCDRFSRVKVNKAKVTARVIGTGKRVMDKDSAIVKCVLDQYDDYDDDHDDGDRWLRMWRR